MLDCTPSSHFRTLQASLPTIFAINRRIVDQDLFPAVAEFLRNRKELRTLHLTVPNLDAVQKTVGFDASIWAVLPSLSNLHGLTITYPSDLSPGLASWLIPRSVSALNLDGVNFTKRDPIPFLNQIRMGVPPNLRFIGLSDFPIRAVSTIIDQGFAMVRVVRVGNNYWTMIRNADSGVIEIDQWPKRRVLYHKAEWLEWLDCQEGQWQDHTDFGL